MSVCFLCREVSAAAGSEIIGEQPLKFRSYLNQPVQRTFILRAGGTPLKNVQVSINDLRDETSGAVILATDITVSPANFDKVEKQETFTVTIVKASRVGHYEGTLDILYDEQSIEVKLDVTIETTPSVAADLAAQGVNIAIQVHPWGGMSSLSKQTLNYIQNSEGNAEIIGINVLSFRGPNGKNMPSGAIKVLTELPITLTQNTRT
jgi:hypothetical protein